MQISNWEDISKTTNILFTKYWRATKKKQRRYGLPIPAQLNEWQPPNTGDLKINFDAAFKDGHTATGVVLRNSQSQIMGAWVNHFSSENPFCAEAEAATQAFRIASELRIERVLIEGDAQTVILALQGMNQFLDWRARAHIDEGRMFLLSVHPYWTVQFSPRQCNSCAHSLAKWAYHSSFSGEVEPARVLGFVN